MTYEAQAALTMIVAMLLGFLSFYLMMDRLAFRWRLEAAEQRADGWTERYISERDARRAAEKELDVLQTDIVRFAKENTEEHHLQIEDYDA